MPVDIDGRWPSCLSPFVRPLVGWSSVGGPAGRHYRRRRYDPDLPLPFTSRDAVCKRSMMQTSSPPQPSPPPTLSTEGRRRS
ncbi:unnamed protein product [Soboliphyme baturini]|uniref:Uncharacterized protein n=1 Tax=Soboliphyme baturini TaxID=241478 RepID=A0A183IU30_9BILA|nr:unnamed protein product [Soboliphyme baturini]